MLINIEQLIVKPVRFRDSIFFLLIIAFFASWAYRLGAGEHAGIVSLFMQLLFITLALSYGVYTILLSQRKFKNATYAYRQYLEQLSKTELLRLLNHDELKPRSRQVVQHTLDTRFPKRTR